MKPFVTYVLLLLGVLYWSYHSGKLQLEKSKDSPLPHTPLTHAHVPYSAYTSSGHLFQRAIVLFKRRKHLEASIFIQAGIRALSNEGHTRMIQQKLDLHKQRIRELADSARYGNLNLSELEKECATTQLLIPTEMSGDSTDTLYSGNVSE